MAGFIEAHNYPEKRQPLGGLMRLYCAMLGQTRFNRPRLSLDNSSGSGRDMKEGGKSG